MTALYIVFAIILFLAVLVFMPISVFLEFNDDFFVAVKLFGITVFNSKKSKKKEKNKDKKPQEQPKKENTVKKIFVNQKEKSGTAGAIKYFAKIAKIILEKLIWFLRKLNFEHIKLNLAIASEDAAKTAIIYGSVCTAVYPLLSLITQNAKVKYKKIDISADFNNTAVKAEFSALIKSNFIYALVGALKGYTEYKKFVKEEEKNG
ncbi:MAG: DUF2953 domain-containing protein [Clostridia bacterium]|nr:DUF2953 domain-containing protein [Clostridia bacterium]